MLVPTTRTTCTDQELCKAFILAWQDTFNNTPSKASIGVIVAQHDLETGSGNSCWNWNLGNIKYVSANGNVDYCALNGVWEIVNGVKVMLKSTDPGSWFRSFPTLKEGIVFYIDFINGKRYKSCWSAVVSGNPAAFAHLLKLAGYYTAPESDYVNAINSYFNKFMKATSFEAALAEVQAVSVPVVESSPPVEIIPESTDVEPLKNSVPPSVVQNTNFLQTIFNTIKKLFGK